MFCNDGLWRTWQRKYLGCYFYKGIRASSNEAFNFESTGFAAFLDAQGIINQCQNY